MGYVDGETLRERVEHKGQLSPRAALKVMQEAAWALGYAHGQRAAVPGEVVDRLEERAARLRERRHTGQALQDTGAALENVRLALVRLRSGAGSVQDLTAFLERARAVGERIDVELEARDEVRGVR